MNLCGLSDSLGGTVDNPPQCKQCGGTTRLDHATCVSCLLKEGLEVEGEASAEIFQSVLAEADVPDTQWRLGNYEILEEIGRGGMGVIYRARQRHSRRIVALKRVLTYQAESHETLTRFRREAAAAASLDHPNILPIYEVSESEDGVPFFSMKLATGGSLRNAGSALRGNPPECVRLVAKVARAIEYAHAHGILHRDLQPGNILLDVRGEPMVSDFGLAKWVEQQSDLTQTLTSFGTPGYIAPEQAEGAELTPAADIYSLGAILFNLLTGRPPFTGANALSVLRQAAATPAPKLCSLAPSLGRDLETITARCLERDPKARYQSAGDLAEDLERSLEGRPIFARRVPPLARIWRWSRRNPIVAGAATICLLLAIAVIWLLRAQVAPTARSPAPEKSIAVLPFENLSQDKQNAFFADGVQDEILTSLSRVADLKVISRTTVMQYKDTAKRNLRDIAQQLGVAHVLEGSVQRTANRVRVNAQLIDARNDAHLWAQTYDGDLANVFAIQSQIAKTIADQLQAKLSPKEEAALQAKPTKDLVAYELYLRAREIEREMVTSVGVIAADSAKREIPLLEEAIRRDPKFVPALCDLAYAHLYLYWVDDQTDARLASAARVLEEAARLQPDAGEVHLARALFLYWGKREYEAALKELASAQRVLPNDSRLPAFTAAIERRQGKFDDAIRHQQQALTMDPRSVFVASEAAFTLSAVHRYDDAAKLMDSALAWKPLDFGLGFQRARLEVAWKADLGLPKALLASETVKAANASDLADARFDLAIKERDYHTAEQVLATGRVAQITNDGFFVPKEWNEAIIARGLGDQAKANAAFLAARDRAAATVHSRPEDAKSLIVLAEIDAALGREEDALREGQHAAELLPIAKDAINGAEIAARLTGVHTGIGMLDRALDELEKATKLPNGVTYGSLKLDVVWDPLRGNPRFEKIVTALAPEPTPPSLLATPGSLPAAIEEKSIAVLPFENLSDDKQNAYFADGVQDEILTDLSRVADLKVISRSSVMQYKDTAKRNLRDVAQQLGVAHVLEGSVQRSANHVRVNAQLIDARNDAHLWAQTYDGDLANVFAIQSQIAKAIAEQLQVRISPREKEAISHAPTTDLVASKLYTRAKDLQSAGNDPNGKPNLMEAARLLDEAVARDSHFLLAYCLLAETHLEIYWEGFDPTPARRDLARVAIQKAARIQPDAGEVHLAQAAYAYHGFRDYDRARVELDRARNALPNDVEVYDDAALIDRRQGRWAEATRNLAHATELDPLNFGLLSDAATTAAALRHYGEARGLLERALKISPRDYSMRTQLALISLHQHADILPLHALVSNILNEEPAAGEKIPHSLFYCALTERDSAAMSRALGAIPAEGMQDNSDFLAPREWYAGLAARAFGDSIQAQASFTAARAVVEKMVREQPNYAAAWGGLGLIDAGLARKDEAVRAGKHACELLPVSRDTVIGPALITKLAVTYAWTGEKDLALEQLSISAQMPSGVTYGELKLDPQWDSLRGDSRFEKIVTALAPKL